VVDGFILLLTALYQKILAKSGNVSGESANPSASNGESAPPSNRDIDNVHNRHNDYDSSSEEDSSEEGPAPPEDASQHRNTRQPFELEGSSVTRPSDLKKIVRKEVGLLKNELHSQLHVELAEVLRNELKGIVREELSRSKEEMIAVLKVANETLMMKFTTQFRDDNQALMQDFLATTSAKAVSNDESQGPFPVNTTTSSANRERVEKITDEMSGDKIFEETTKSCAPNPPETTHVQTINETHSKLGHERFKRASNLAVLFTRSTKPSSSSQVTHNENDSKILNSKNSSDPGMPQENISHKESQAKSTEHSNASLTFPQFPQRLSLRSLSTQLLDVDDQSDDDLKETVIPPKNF